MEQGVQCTGGTAFDQYRLVLLLNIIDSKTEEAVEGFWLKVEVEKFNSSDGNIFRIWGSWHSAGNFQGENAVFH